MPSKKKKAGSGQGKKHVLQEEEVRDVEAENANVEKTANDVETEKANDEQNANDVETASSSSSTTCTSSQQQDPAGPAVQSNQSKEELARLLYSPGPDCATKNHEFWSTQPMKKLEDEYLKKDEVAGPIEAAKAVTEVRQVPYALPAQFEWASLDLASRRSLESG